MNFKLYELYEHATSFSSRCCSILSATAAENCVYVNWYSTELWYKEKKCLYIFTEFYSYHKLFLGLQLQADTQTTVPCSLLQVYMC